jgi:hypothetical protein
MTENKTTTIKRFPDCTCSEDCLHDYGSGKNYKNSCDLCTDKRNRSAAVAMASAAHAERLWQRGLFFGYFLWTSKESNNNCEAITEAKIKLLSPRQCQKINTKKNNLKSR